MTSQDRLLALHETMDESNWECSKQLRSLQNHKPILIAATVAAVLGGVATYYGITTDAMWIPQAITLCFVSLVVIPLAAMSRAFDSKKFTKCIITSYQDAINYQEAIHGAITAHGYSGIVPQNDPRLEPYCCYASKDGVVSTITAIPYEHAIVLSSKEEPGILIPKDSDRTSET